MAAKRRKVDSSKRVETIRHESASRSNIPSAEHESLLAASDADPLRVAYERRNRDLDPQLVWRGKDQQDWSDLVVQAPPLFIQERVHPKVLVDDLMRRTAEAKPTEGEQIDLFSDFNGVPDGDARTEFYQHAANWTNRMILGDSLQVMASLAEREGLRGKVQCIYFDPPYGIKFNSNFQWSTTSRSVSDGKADHITREPEQVKAFRDTWRDGIHSYLTYLRDRLVVARDLLSQAGSIFVQIGDENVHFVRSVMEEVFGSSNLISQIGFRTTTGRSSDRLAAASNYILWAARDGSCCKYRALFQDKSQGTSTDQVYSLVRGLDGEARRMRPEERSGSESLPEDLRVFRADNLTSTRPAGDGDLRNFTFRSRVYRPGKGTFKSGPSGILRLARADRLWPTTRGTLQYVRYIDDFPVIPFSNMWMDTGTGSFTDDKVYVVQTGTKVIERCLLMATDPGDLVLDPTCGSGTAAYVAEQWGRRWITIDTSRVALALARARVMGARYPYYLLADSQEGQRKEAEVSGGSIVSSRTHGDIRHGFVYERVPHVTLKSIANNEEIDVIWEDFQTRLEPLRAELNGAVGRKWEEWEIPREAESGWSVAAKRAHRAWWEQRIERQRRIDASIAARADQEFLYDKPYPGSGVVRVAGPFTVESLSPHRTLPVGVDGGVVAERNGSPEADERDFTSMILDNLRVSGVQQAHKADRIDFESLTPWPGDYVCAEGRYRVGDDESGEEKRAAIFVGPEFGTVGRAQLIEAAREAADAGFDTVVSCAFNYDAHATELSKLGRVPILKARMNADLHMGEDLKTTDKANLFVIFGEPDIDLLPADGDRVQVRINGVDVFRPQTGKVTSSEPDEIACWFIDTDYNSEAFFVRHAYFLGAADPYKSLKTSLKAEIDADAWETLHSATSRPFAKPSTGRIAVKVINHLGDEVMKVFRVE
ncbi:MAG: site-specific DNA-methyltransferase [Dehalococcoidia bacterium]